MSWPATIKAFMLAVVSALGTKITSFRVFLMWWIAERSRKRKLYDITLLAGCVSAIHLSHVCILFHLRVKVALFRLWIGFWLGYYSSTAAIIPGPVPEWFFYQSSPSVMRYWCKGLGILGSLACYVIVTMMFMYITNYFYKWLLIR